MIQATTIRLRQLLRPQLQISMESKLELKQKLAKVMKESKPMMTIAGKKKRMIAKTAVILNIRRVKSRECLIFYRNSPLEMKMKMKVAVNIMIRMK